MNLYIIRYLLFLILEGEKSNRELAEGLGGAAYNASHALSILQRFGLVIHPRNRIRSWVINPKKPVVVILEKLLLVSKNNSEIKKLLTLPSGIRIGAQQFKDKTVTIKAVMAATGLSKVTVIKTLEKMVLLGLLEKKTSKPNLYYLSNTILSKLFFEACRHIVDIFTDKRGVTSLSRHVIIQQIKDEESVLILVHYGSLARGKGDSLSDVDIFVVTRDKISRGEIISRYSRKDIDLAVYSKSGFLQLLKTHPDFIANLATAKILKGKDILKAVIQ